MEGHDRHREDLIIFLCFILLTSIGLFLRDILNFSDEVRFISDSLGNIGGVIVASFLFFWWGKESRFTGRELIILYVCIGLIIYEFLQMLIPWQTFDIKDIWGTIVGGIIASLINLLIFIFRKYKRVSKL